MTVACCARSATAPRAAPASWTTTRTSRTASWSSTWRRARSAGSSRRADSRCSPSSSSRTRFTAASTSRAPTATHAFPGRRTSRTHPCPPGTRCSPGCSFGSGVSGATTSSRHGPCRCSASPSRRSSGRRVRSRGRSAGLISGSALLARSRSPGRSARLMPAFRPSCSSRSSTGGYRAWRGRARAAGRACSSFARDVRSRFATTRRSRPGTGSRCSHRGECATARSRRLAARRTRAR